MRWLDGLTDNGHEFKQALGDAEGQGNLVCWCPQGRRVRHDLATEQQQCPLRRNQDSALITAL